MRAARAEVDLGAIAHNVGVLRAEVAPALMCAVVKADGYGHGAIAVSEAVLDAGADWLAVALVEEAAVLRKAGITRPILLLSQPRLADLAAAVRYDLRVCIISTLAAEMLAVAAREQGRVVPVHLKVDTGMNRIGVAPADALALAAEIVRRPELELEGVFTHCAVADEPDNPFTVEQFERYEAVLDELATAGITPSIRHAANSATAIVHPRGPRPLPGWPPPSICGRRCRCEPKSRWSSGWTPARESRTGCGTRSRPTPLWRPFPSGTPTVSLVVSASSVARSSSADDGARSSES
jgi:alanine racemase